MANPMEYGLPGVAALDSPYGLAAGADVPMPMRLPVLQFPQQMQRPMPGMGVLSPGLMRSRYPVQPAQTSNVTPFRADKATPAPTVGKDLSFAQLVDLQRKAESSGNYQALNREKPGNTASGAYQYTDATWNNYGGYPKAMLAPKAVQDKRFAEDVAKRAAQYGGDIFKTLAAHYLPALADNPAEWREAAQVKLGRRTVTVKPVETYLRHVLKNTHYEKLLDAYLNAYQ